MDTNFYDVIVCGAELGRAGRGRAAGRRGCGCCCSVTTPSARASTRGGYTLSREPALLPALDVAPSPASCGAELASRSSAGAPALQPASSGAAAPPLGRARGARAGAARAGARVRRPRPTPSRRRSTAWRRPAAPRIRCSAGADAAPRRLLGAARGRAPRVAAPTARHGSAGAAPGAITRCAPVSAAPARRVDGAGARRRSGTVGQARAFDLARRGTHRLEGG